MFIVKHRKLFFLVSALLVAASIVVLAVWGLNWGIDFKGGSLMEVEFKQDRPSNQEVKDVLIDLNLGEINVQPTKEKNIILRMRDIDEETHQKVLLTVQQLGEVEELRFESVGPVIGQELKKKAFYSIIVALIAILLFIALAFRKVSFIVKSYKYGVLAIIALFHDIIIVLGVFVVLGHFFSVEIGIAFVAALLATLGYSVNDTIVVFDRVRENLLVTEHREDFDKLVGRSLKQTIVRSVNTSLTTILVLLAVLLFGGATIQYFVLALIIGIAAGTYSSLFIASPLLVSWEMRRGG
ncbi:Protein translocase subunit SecF [subsurface metagenome]